MGHGIRKEQGVHHLQLEFLHAEPRARCLPFVVSGDDATPIHTSKRGWTSVDLWLAGPSTVGPSPGPTSCSAIHALLCPALHSALLRWRNVM